MAQSLSEMISSNITFIDRLLMCEEALRDCSLQEMAEGLLEAIRNDGSVSYLIGKPGRYRTTPLASVIEALFDSEMLPEYVLQVMQNKLYEYKDIFQPENTDEDDKIDKNPEDMAAWSVDEGPSVWTTSKAVCTLIKTGFHKNCTPEQLRGLQNAIEWLDNQKYRQDNGAFAWGFQRFELADCAPSIPMTALALKALGIAYEHRKEVHKGTRWTEHGYFKTYINGIKYLKDNCHYEGDKCFWEYKGKPSLTATVWSLEAMEALIKDHRDVAIISQQDLKSIMEKALNWVINEAFPMFADGNDDHEPSDPFFEYNKTKYKEKTKTRVFYSFVPYYASFLMKNGVSPFHAKICGCIRWLIENKEKNWAISDYNSNEPCSFSAAMAINVIVVWLKSVNERTYKSFAAKMISGNSLEDVCNNCEIYDNTINNNDDEHEENKDKLKPKLKFAALFIITGIVLLLGLVFLFKDTAVALLADRIFVSILGYVLLIVPGTVITLAVRKGVKMFKKFFQKSNSVISVPSEGLDE